MQVYYELNLNPILYRYRVYLNWACSYVLEEYAAARRASVVRSFLAALSGVGGMRPIEQSAHDSLRYAGDMLAALHLAAASENDLLESLLKQCPSTKGELERLMSYVYVQTLLMYSKLT